MIMKIVLLCIAVAAASVILALLAICRNVQKRHKESSEQIEHFLLYAENPLPETLREGELANLNNQISRLEQQFLYQRAQSVRREEELTRFVENMAHQMKNAVTALQIQLDLLTARLPEERPTIEKSQACLERLTGEIDRILKSSQLAAGKVPMEFEPLELGAELDACVQRMRPLAEQKRVSLSRQGEAGLFGDSFWLSQSFDNLLKNAIEHTPEHTAVTVQILDEGSRIKIRIEDEGPGILPGELPELFARFHRGSEGKAGYGIGLSMAKDVIEAHHGTLTAGNRESGGARFEIQLPRIDGAKTYSPQWQREDAPLDRDKYPAGVCQPPKP